MYMNILSSIFSFFQELDKVTVSLSCPSPFSSFTNVTLGDGRQATVLLENPLGVEILSKGEADEIANKLFI